MLRSRIDVKMAQGVEPLVQLTHQPGTTDEFVLRGAPGEGRFAPYLLSGASGVMRRWVRIGEAAKPRSHQAPLGTEIAVIVKVLGQRHRIR